MSTTPLPILVSTRKIVSPDNRLNIEYPFVMGMHDMVVQSRINDTILSLVKSLVVQQGYYSTPGMNTTGFFELKTNQRNVLSLTIGNYSMAPMAAHGLTILKSLTFDVRTGRTYSLADMFKPASDYQQVLSKIVEEQIKKRDIFVLDSFKGVSSNQDYYIADKCLVLYYQLYELTAYAYGFPMFPISVFDIEDIVREESPLGRMATSS